MTLQELKQELRDLYFQDVIVNSVINHAEQEDVTAEQALIWMVKELAMSKNEIQKQLIELHMYGLHIKEEHS